MKNDRKGLPEAIDRRAKAGPSFRYDGQSKWHPPGRKDPPVPPDKPPREPVKEPPRPGRDGPDPVPIDDPRPPKPRKL